MSGNKKNESSFLVQGSILAVASIISRIIGLVYRIPLTGIIGDVGNNYYGSAYDIYSILLIISSYSLPLAVSKLVSSRVAMGQRKNAYRILKGSLLFALVTGSLATLIVFFGANFITGTIFKTPLSIFALRVLAPNLIIVAILGVLRGFFQGLGTMMPSAVSQIIEQIINAVVSVMAAYILFGYGAKIGAVLGNEGKYAAAYGAAGGTLGTLLGACGALLFIGFLFLVYMRVFKRSMRRDRTVKKESYLTVFRVLILTIVPVLLSTTIYNISSVIDQGIFKNTALALGSTENDIDLWWGVFTGKYKVLINVPISIASALAASSVPALAASFANKEGKKVRAQIDSAMHFSMIIAFPCTVGMALLASPILQLLFGDATELAANMLAIGAVSIVFTSISTLSNGILQGINRMKAPVTNAVIALVVHVGVLLALMYGFHMHIYAVVLANAFFALLMCILNQHCVRKYSGYRPNIKETFIKPALASAIMGFFVWITYKGVHFLLGNAVSTVVSILVGMFIYFISLLLLKGVTEKELRRIPKGTALISFAKKLHLL